MAEAVQDNTPMHSQGYGPAEDADATRQAQMQVANDAPTDVNMNAVIARSQAQTTDQSAKNFEANADRRNKLADYWMAAQMANGGKAA
jgi:hypothetical protein